MLKQKGNNMERVVTPNGYVVVERINGLDVYEDEAEKNIVCELNGKELKDYSYNGQISGERLDVDIEDELDTMRIMDKLDYPYIH